MVTITALYEEGKPDDRETQRHSVALSGTQWHSVTLGGTRWHSVTLGDTRWHSVALGGSQRHSAYHQEDCHRSPQTLHSSVSSASSHARPTPLHLHVGFTHEGLALPSAGLRTLDACNSLRSSASSPKSSTSVAAAFASRLVCRRGAVTSSGDKTRHSGALRVPQKHYVALSGSLAPVVFTPRAAGRGPRL